MNNNFDKDQAAEFLNARESGVKEQHEQERIAVLDIVEKSLKHLFSNKNVEVYLVGSIIKPYMFHPHSDVDVVLKNFNGDRFDVWTKLEEMVHRNVEVILFENCNFQEHVIKMGHKVI